MNNQVCCLLNVSFTNLFLHIEPVQPRITSPSRDISIMIISVIGFDSFSLTHNCLSSGTLTSTITWTSNTNLVLNVIAGTLTVHSQDLQPGLSINIFTCTANNSVGLDSKSISVEIDIKPQLTAPQPPIKESTSINSVDIRWVEYIPSIYINSYELCVRSTTDSACIQIINTVSTEYSIENLESDTTYSITIVAITVFGSSPTSGPLTVTSDNPGNTFVLPV